MIEIHTFTFNPFGENTYVLANDQGACWIVDPGMADGAEQDELWQFLKAEKLTPQAVINTHAHIDHILGVQVTADRYGIPFYLHPLEKPVLQWAPNSAAMFGLPPFPVPQPTHWLEHGQSLALGEDSVQVLLTPGHSPGSVCFYHKESGWLIGGDVLFAGSIGRTDLPGGDHDTLLRSISRELLPLPDATVVYPGHGPATTIGAERNGNPFLR